jgi:hypothetical protein
LGFLHWMQREASSLAIAGVYPRDTSSNVFFRTPGGFSGTD